MHVGWLERLHALHTRCPLERTVESVCPAVIATLHRVALATAVGDRAGAVEAYVVKAAQRVPIAQHDDAVVAHLRREELAVLGHLIHPSHELPRVRKHALHLQFEIDGIVVQARRNGRGALDVRIEGEDNRHIGNYGVAAYFTRDDTKSQARPLPKCMTVTRPCLSRTNHAVSSPSPKASR